MKTCCPHCCEFVPFDRVPEFAAQYAKARGFKGRYGVSRFGLDCGMAKATLIHARHRGYIANETAKTICLHLNAVTGKQGTPEAITPQDFFKTKG